MLAFSSSGGDRRAKPIELRSKAPVFVLGSPRSGTTLLYHMLLSAGSFVVYRSETHAFNLLEARYGDLGIPRNKKRMMQAWFKTRMFEISGLNKDEIEAKIMARCKNGGDFLRIVMGEIGRKQGVERWAECTPDHLQYIARIKKTIPDALIIHIIRDGRDVALSLDKQKWIRPLPGDASMHLEVAALYWEWIVNRGRRAGSALGKDYCEIRFEELIGDPRGVLREVSSFIDQDLDYDHIRQGAIGSVAEPNTSFENSSRTDGFNPVARWRAALSAEKLRDIEALIGGTLEKLGYTVGNRDLEAVGPSELSRLRARYSWYFDLKFWLKNRAPAGRYLVTKDLSWL
jgi:hypothetical protein